VKPGQPGTSFEVRFFASPDGLWVEPIRTRVVTLPEGMLSRAQETCDALLALPEDQRWIEEPGGPRARIVGAAARGGLRIEGTFEPRTVSLLDLGWVIAADADVTEEGGVLDEERVNRLRYLEGTPKGSTRWIDTQWALAAWSKAKPLLPSASTKSAS